jgi:2-polyprenyl-3-methyl-5-hydroxy-6-metoxy-1,4-benzoquinol methylase
VPGEFAEFEELRHCPVCDAPGPFPAVFERVARCPSCRVYFANPRPTQPEIALSYESGATYREWIPQKAEREVMWRSRLSWVTGVPARSTLLDVGTGDGHFLTVAREAGFACLGTELSRNGADCARAEGHEILGGQFCELDFGGRQFDVITMWHVLEHVPNPGETLARIYELLRPGGQFLVAVPNEDNSFVNHALGRNKQNAPLVAPSWGHEIHLTYFQAATLRSALQRARFQVERMSVDYLYLHRSARNQAVLAFHRTMNALFGWHFGLAMAASCRKPR